MTCKSKGRWYMFFVGKKIPYNLVTKLYGVSLTLCSLNIQNIFTTSKFDTDFPKKSEYRSHMKEPFLVYACRY